MKRIAIVAVVGCAVLLIYAYSAIGQNQTQAIQGQRIGRGSDSSRVGALPDADAPVPIRSIDGVATVRDGDYTIDDTRPLEQATKLLERKLGVPIWYEDPHWAFQWRSDTSCRFAGESRACRKEPKLAWTAGAARGEHVFDSSNTAVRVQSGTPD